MGDVLQIRRSALIWSGIRRILSLVSAHPLMPEALPCKKNSKASRDALTS
ncbi:MAG: hypothetical protein ACI9U2_001018 [Bradymonadia bacterium]|jgi:hypothetical protein